MRYYLDTEFIERGHEHPIELISIGVVSEDGREFYAVCADGWDASHASEWVKANVLPHLGDEKRIPRADIATCLLDFVTGPKPAFWAYFADYDWVVLCQLFGSMVDLPKGWPMFCRDMKQLQVESYPDVRFPKQATGAHNALADARHIKAMHEALLAHGTSRP